MKFVRLIVLTVCAMNLSTAYANDELSPKEIMIGEKFEIGVTNDPDGREYMLRFSDPKFFSHTQKLRKVWGVAKVLDGQTLVINGERIQLNGIRAPEISQVCNDKVLNFQFDAGGFSLSRLKAKARPNKAVVCYVKLGPKKLGTCFVWGFFGPMNLARLLVREGAAWAFPVDSSPYIRDEGWAEGVASRDDDPLMKNIWHTDCQRPN